MNGFLVRVGVDQAYGGWNAPVDPRGRAFVYVPIPETAPAFHKGGRRTLGEFRPALEAFQSLCPQSPWQPIAPTRDDEAVHLDPDFDHLTYGDDGSRRGAGIAKLQAGDLLAFYSGLRPIVPCEHKLIYAIIGLYIVDEVVGVAAIPPARWCENAHTRKDPHYPSDIVVRARKGCSGRLQQCLPIGQWRSGAYRVREDVLTAWGGLSVKDGFIQRSAVPPRFTDAQRFYDWFIAQNVHLLERNN